MCNTYSYKNKTTLHRGIDFLSAPLRIALGGKNITIHSTFEEKDCSCCYRIAIAIFTIVIFPVGIISALSFVAKMLSSESVIVGLFVNTITLKQKEETPHNQMALNYAESMGCEWEKIGAISGKNISFTIYQDKFTRKYYVKDVPKQVSIQSPRPYNSDQVKELDEKDNNIGENCFIATVILGDKNLKFAVKKDAQVSDLITAVEVCFSKKIIGLAYKIPILSPDAKFSELEGCINDEKATLYVRVNK